MLGARSRSHLRLLSSSIRPIGSRRCLAAAALALAGSPALAMATHFSATWKPNTTGNWNVTANWNNTPTFPNNGGGDDFDAILNEPAGNCTLNVPITITGFALGNGTLTGAAGGSLTVIGAGTWSGGALNGPGSLALNGATFLINGGAHALAQFDIRTSAATLTNWSSGAISAVANQGGAFNNAGTFTDTTDAAWTWSGVQTPVFNNLAGAHYQKTAGTLNAFKEIQAAFNNGGTVDVGTAELWLKGGGASAGTFNVATDATLLFSDFNETRSAMGAPTTTLAASSVVNSFGFVDFINFGGNAHSDVFGTYDSTDTVISPGTSGVVRFLNGARVSTNIVGDWFVDSGSLVFNTGQANGITMQRLLLNGGAVSGSDNVRVLTVFNWTAGKLSGFRVTFAQGGIHLFNTGLKSLEDHTLINQTGIADWSGGSISLSNSAIYNEAPAQFDVQFDGTIFNKSFTQHSAIINRGTFLKSAGAGTATVQDIGFYNSGTVDVRSGTLRLAGGGLQDGTFLIAGNSTLQFQGTSFQNFDPNHSFRPTSVVGVGSGTVQLLGIATFQAGSRVNVNALRVEGPVSGAASISSNIGWILNGGVANLNFGSSWLNSGSLNVGGTGAGGGTLIINPQAGVSAAGGLNIGAGGNLAINGGGTLSTPLLALGAGGNAGMSSGGGQLLDIGAATIDTAASSKLDLNDNDARFTASSYATVAGYISFARHGGAWDRGGMTSTAARNRPSHNTTLGVLKGAEYRAIYGPAAPFNGMPVNTSDTLVKYTYYGDTDLNGRINFDDYVRTDNGFNNHLTGWVNGDFDLNNVVNFDDYVLIDLAFNTQSGTLGRALRFLDGTDRGDDAMQGAALDAVRQHAKEFGDAYSHHFLESVPEPASLAPAVFGIALTTWRCRRHGRL